MMAIRPSIGIACAAIAMTAIGNLSASAQEPKLPKWVTEAGPAWQPPAEGVVRDAKSAISIARVVWFSMHPDFKKPTDDDWQKSMEATLSDGVWEVTEPMKQGEIGGSLFIFISQKDARVLDVFLTQ
ncbi:MAG TPA: hypothetical protein VGT78_14825 [Rhizomicrobium sp.]|nr:hypothetical protein [Rhizomicrobium sp.]